MNSSSRAHVASSFTILKGALIEESYSFLADWAPRRSGEENLGYLQGAGQFLTCVAYKWRRC